MPKTDALIPLQKIDLEIHALKSRRDEKPKLLAPVEARLARARENLEALRGEIKGLKLEGSRRELAVKEVEDRISKLATQANMAKKNDEYQAFQKEISGFKADRSRIEDGLLDVYMQADEKSKLEKIRETEAREAESEFQTAERKNEAEIAELDRQISRLAAQREGVAASIDKELLRAYDRILRVKEDGLALAPAQMYESVEEEGVQKYWGCGGCSVGVTSQDVNELRKGRDIVLCRSCSRILYWKEETKPAAAP